MSDKEEPTQKKLILQPGVAILHEAMELWIEKSFKNKGEVKVQSVTCRVLPTVVVYVETSAHIVESLAGNSKKSG